MEKIEGDILQKIGNGNPFSVPENYFENFAGQMSRMAAGRPAVAPRKAFLTPTRLTILFSSAAAAVVAVFVAAALFRAPSVPAPDLQAQETSVPAAVQTWLAYLDDDTQLESVVSNFESEIYGYQQTK